MARAITVCVAGGFDGIHPGHIGHLRDAKALAGKRGRLVVILNPDPDMIRKKGWLFQSYKERKCILEAIRFVDVVVPAIDGDGTVAETLRRLHPTIFAKGGDRVPENMPENEIAVCDEIGCQIIYGVGGSKTHSSSELVKRAANHLEEIRPK